MKLFYCNQLQFITITLVTITLMSQHAIQQLCQQDQAAVSIKTQVCDLAQMIVTTVHQIYTIFYSGHSNGPDTGQQAGDGQEPDTKGQGGSTVP